MGTLGADVFIQMLPKQRHQENLKPRACYFLDQPLLAVFIENDLTEYSTLSVFLLKCEIVDSVIFFLGRAEWSTCMGLFSFYSSVDLWFDGGCHEVCE